MKEQDFNDYIREIKEKKKELTTTGILQQIKVEKLKETIKDRQEIKTSPNAPLLYNQHYKEFLDNIENSSIDLLLTDPPYTTEDYVDENFIKDWLSRALPKIKETGRAYICIGSYPNEILMYLTELQNYDFIVDCPLIWDYKNCLGNTPSMKYNLCYQMILHLYRDTSNKLDNSITNEMFSVQSINAPDGRVGDRDYKWQKPDELIERLIIHSTKEGDSIIDCFAGSGVILYSAKKLNRVATGSEISKVVCKIAEQKDCKVIYN